MRQAGNEAGISSHGARCAIGARNAEKAVGEHRKLTGERRAKYGMLRAVRHRFECDLITNECVIDAREACFGRAVADIVSEQKPLTNENLFSLGLRYRVFVDALADVSIVPIEPDNTRQINH